jgi:hypothetical protein
MFRAAMAPRMAAGMVDGNQIKTSLNQPVEDVAAGQAAEEAVTAARAHLKRAASLRSGFLVSARRVADIFPVSM